MVAWGWGVLLELTVLHGTLIYYLVNIFVFVSSFETYWKAPMMRFISQSPAMALLTKLTHVMYVNPHYPCSLLSRCGEVAQPPTPQALTHHSCVYPGTFFSWPPPCAAYWASCFLGAWRGAAAAGRCVSAMLSLSPLRCLHRVNFLLGI